MHNYLLTTIDTNSYIDYTEYIKSKNKLKNMENYYINQGRAEGKYMVFKNGEFITIFDTKVEAENYIKELQNNDNPNN